MNQRATTQRIEYEPDGFDEYIGCTSLIKKLKVEVKGALHLQKAVRPIFFFGAPGTGKTTLALLVAKMRKARCIVLHGSRIKKADLDILFRARADATTPESRMLSLEGEAKRDPVTKKWVFGPTGEPRPTTFCLFDECERIGRDLFQSIYPAIPTGDEPATYYTDFRGTQSKFFVPAWTPVFITNHPEVAIKNACGLFDPSGRCAIHHHFSHYANSEIETIISQFARKNKITIDDEAVELVAVRSQGTPRQALHAFNNAWLYLCSQQFDNPKTSSRITRQTVVESMALEGLDEAGLGPNQREYLTVLANERDGTMALPSLVAKLASTKQNVEQTIEPILVRTDMVRISGAGRSITDKGREHIQGLNSDSLIPNTRIE